MLSSHCLHAQCWIMTVDRGNYFSEIKDLNTAKDSINTSLQPGSIAIVKVGEKSVKVLMK